MPMTLDELAGKINARVRGDGSLRVSRCAGLEEAGGDAVSFLANRKYVRLVASSTAAAVIVSPADAEQAPGKTVLIADDPYFAFREAVVALHGHRPKPAPGVSPQAFVDPTAQVHPEASVAPFAYVGARAKVGKGSVLYPHSYVGPDAVVGDDCLLFPNVTVYDFCVLGNRVTLHAGCSIGQDGFGYATHRGAHHKIPQVGNAVLEDDVEMGANCAIDRATVGSTRIGKGTKFSDLVAIGHGVTLGPHNLLVAQVGIAGSTQTGAYVVMGGQVGTAGHLKIGDQVQIAAQAGVMTDLEPKTQYGGTPAQKLNDAKRTVLAMARLPDLMGEFRKLQRRVAELEAKQQAQSKPPA
ncbi:MAG: UDP-3-O-(3-hydroxymyristoyl)glucosamine N-acyltransferase [Planctomycetota bacterium]|nr:UDP-3-O-(3-hydroxymyristoyl)glucosamine N-acyltransferase [Planctomycetota bacterium]